MRLGATTGVATYFIIILAFAGALWWFNHQRQQRLDADPAQRHLAALLVAAVSAQPGASKGAVAEELARIAKNGADRRVRLTHAVMLVRSEAAPELYAQVLSLSREL